MGRSVPTLQSDSLFLGGVASFVRKILENECLFFLQVGGVSEAHTRGCGRRAHPWVFLLRGSLICLLVALPAPGCPSKEGKPALVLTKAELFFSVEPVLYEGS